MITRTDFEHYYLPRIKAAWGYFQQASAQTGIPASVLAAVACRETGVRNISGDSGHGHGVMQIDDRSHSAFTSSPDVWDWLKNILYGARLLASNLRDAMNDGVDEFNALRVAIAGYNQGMSHTGGAIADYRNYGDPDRTTTGGDYSRDVLQVAGWVEEFYPGSGAADPSKKKMLWWLTGLGALLLP